MASVFQVQCQINQRIEKLSYAIIADSFIRDTQTKTYWRFSFIQYATDFDQIPRLEIKLQEAK
jgi:hypothetical protein